MKHTKSSELFRRARVAIPGGVNSPVRAFKSVDSEPFFVARGKGAFLFDVDGNRYIDYVQSWGASILGHAHPVVVDAVSSAAARGTSFGAPTEAEVLLAQRIVASVPGCDMVRLVSSGTEAAMSAIRLARAATRRDRIVKFAGCYHGHSDVLLAAGGSGLATLGLPASAGVPESAVKDTLVVAYNVVPEIDERVACVIVEPIAANMGLVPPEPGFLEGLRRTCDEHGALLIFDEVITGFRVGRSGATGLYGVRPDLFCFGKVIGGGLPLAAFGGRAELMGALAPDGPVYQAGTLSGNPLATAAGLAVLELLAESVYTDLATNVRRLALGIADAMHSAGVAVEVPVAETLFSLFFADHPVRNFDDAQHAATNGRYTAFFHAMLDAGISFAPSPYEVAFCSLAHGEEEIDATLAAAETAATLVAKSG
ncbi:MAG: glutamate-1-semialdehyde 2,1-aminomutase [Acidimicrobiales bacterium]